MRRVLTGVLLSAALVAPTVGVASADEGAGASRPTAPAADRSGDDRTRDYLVVLRDTAPRSRALDVRRVAERAGGTVSATYDTVLNGFAASLPPAAVADLRADPTVAFVERDGIASVADDQVQPPSWGLDRVDQPYRPRDRVFHQEQTGSGVTAYVIDSGVRRDHVQFEGRAVRGFDAFRNRPGGGNDCNGHGTHVAGTVGGRDYGVAKDVEIVPVKVLDCDGFGSWGTIIAGIEWVAEHHTSGPAVANISIQGEFRRAVNKAVDRAIADGITFAIAAGNFGQAACDFSPSSSRRGLTVGATNIADRQAGFSNDGRCVDLYAPGVNIASAWPGSPQEINVISGTSMAAPHVAGAAALYLESDPTASPRRVGAAILGGATRGVVRSAGPGSPDLLLHSTLVPDTGAVDNPGFEQGQAGWTTTPKAIRFDHPRRVSGAWNACLTPPRGRAAWLRQRVVVPASGTLSFAVETATQEPGVAAVDRLRVQVIAGDDVTTLATWSNLDAAPGSTGRTVDLSAFAGQAVDLRFHASDQRRRPTTFCLDDVALG